jgi:hypothetical protein
MLSKQRALEKFQQQIDQLEGFYGREVPAAAFEHWWLNTLNLIKQAFDSDSEHVKDFMAIRFMANVSKRHGVSEGRSYDMQEGIDAARAILNSYYDEIAEYWPDTPEVVKKEAMALVVHLCERFHLVARQLRCRHEDRPSLIIEDEYDVQDLMHTLLKLEFDDVRPEEWTPSYAGRSSRMDFLLKLEQVVIEVKKTRTNLGAKELGDQLIIDIGRYQFHPDCRVLVCFAYDPEGRIANPRGIENDLTGDKNGLRVKVIIAPQ